MAFPRTQLPLRVHIAPGAEPGADIGTWPSWVDVTSQVREKAGVFLGDGRPNEAANVDPGSVALTLNNQTGNFVPRNPLGAYYPALRRNCPIRVGTICGADTFTRTVSSGWGTADDGNTWALVGTAADWAVASGKATRSIATAASAASGTLTGAEAFNVEASVTGSVPVVATGSPLYIAGLARFTNQQNYYMIRMEFRAGGAMNVNISRQRGGVFTVLAALDLASTYTAGQAYRLKWAVIGSSLMAKVWDPTGAEPAGWQVAFNDTLTLMGAANGVYLWRQTGNTNPGAVVFSIDDFTVEAVEAIGAVTEWPVRWDKSGKDSTAPIKASGILRRLSQGTAPLRSPLYRQLSAQKVTGYWPLEDDATTAVGDGFIAAGSAVPWARSAQTTDVSFGAATDLPGALQVAQLGETTSQIRMSTPRRVPSGEKGSSFLFFVRAPSNPGSGNWSTIVNATAYGRVQYWQIALSGDAIRIGGLDDNGTYVVGPSTSALAGDVTKWWAIQLETSMVAGTVTWSLIWHRVGTDYATADTGTYASSSIPSMGSAIFVPGQYLTGLYMSQVYMGGESLPFVDYSFFAVANGYIGELASDRILRLCREESVPCYAEPGDSSPLGAQRVDSLIPLLRAAEQADYGVLFESGNGLGYRPRTARRRRPVSLALDRAAGHLADPPEPTDDDQRLRNDVTVGRDGGAQGVRAFDEESIRLDGRYDEGFTVNLASDAPLPGYAAWRVYLGTRPDLRWPSITLDFARNPGLLPAWRSRPGWGQRMTSSNELAQVIGEGPDVIIEGITQTLMPYGWKVEANCSPAKPWDTSAVGDPVARPRVGSNNTTTTSSLTTSATSVPYTVAAGGWAWITAALHPTKFPLDIIVGGERMTVTAATSSVFTVVRAVNGVVKAHAAGTAVRLYKPTIVAY